MTTDPMSIHSSQNVPAPAAGHLRPAERFASFADYAESTTSLPQPAATSLDVARFHAFTGELTFSVDPAIRLYLDGGSVYHAERDGDPPLSRVLLDAGAVDPVQLRRGIVSVGDVEHLGRLFDREPTIDRDVVMVVVERATETLVQQIANSGTATVTASAYRHHPSGIHRWFVAPIERVAAHRPASGVMQVDRSVVEELPRLAPPPALPEHQREDDESVDDALHIEWAEPDLSNLGRSARTDGLAPPTVDDVDGVDEFDIDIEAELGRFDADRADWATTSARTSDTNDQIASEDVPSSLGEFRIVWPNGTRDETIISADGVPVEQPAAADEAASNGAASNGAPTGFDPPIDSAPPPDSAARAGADPDPLSAADDLRDPNHRDPNDHRDPNQHRDPNDHHSTDLPAPSATAGTGLRIEPVQIDWIPEPDAAVPDDVASVVRRALRAIESAGTRPIHPDTVVPPAGTAAVPPMAEAGPVGFAPPSMDTRVEAVPERAKTDDDFWALTEVLDGDTEASLHRSGDAAAVFADGDADGRDDDDKSERRSALRRLIGSLRSKD